MQILRSNSRMWALLGWLTACGSVDGDPRASSTASAAFALDTGPMVPAGRYVLVSVLSGYCVEAVAASGGV